METFLDSTITALTGFYPGKPEVFTRDIYRFETAIARTRHKCERCPEPIYRNESYYCVFVIGSGLHGLKTPDRVHIGCADSYVNKWGHQIKEGNNGTN